jgi:dimethylsulfone monooxygenase
MDMFHGAQREYDERYAFGQEWIDLVKQLWSEAGSFDAQGSFSRASTWRPTRSPTRCPAPC